VLYVKNKKDPSWKNQEGLFYSSISKSI
jgi:hypothetical protein